MEGRQKGRENGVQEGKKETVEGRKVMGQGEGVLRGREGDWRGVPGRGTAR